MIYPKSKSKVRSFSIGGAMGSLFNNPGTYLGIQYVPTAVETPDLDGLQYLLQQDEARRVKQTEQASKSKADFETLREAMKGAQGLDRETEDFISGIEGQFNSWYGKYNTPEKMLSSEALAEKARLDRNIMVGVNILKNSADEYQSSYKRSENVLGDVYTDGGNVMIQDSQNPSSIKSVPIEEFFGNKEAYEGFNIMRNDDIFSWRRKHRGFGTSDNIKVDQYSEKETREYINDHFKEIGTNSVSIEGASEYASVLANAGLDPRSFTASDLKVKAETGQINLQQLYSTFVNTLDHKVMKSLISSMLSKGINPYETHQFNGQEISNINLRLHEILTGTSAKLDSSIDISKDTPTGEGAKSDVLTNILNRNVSLSTLKQNDPTLNRQVAERDFFNVFTGTPVTVEAMAVPNMNIEDKERLYGRPIAFHQITDPGTLMFEGKPVKVGSEVRSHNNAKYFFSGKEPTVITTDMKDAEGNDRVVNYLEMDVVVNEDGLADFGLNKSDVKQDGTGMVNFIKDDELASLPGMSEVMKKSISTNWSLRNNYIIRVQMPLADHAGHGGKTPGTASGSYNSQVRASYEQQKRQAEKNANNVSAQQNDMLRYLRP